MLSYKKSGVHRDRGDQLVELIKKMVRHPSPALKKRVKSSVGGYASIYEIHKTRWIAATTDGVGTKLRLAFDLNKHDTVGIDLVAMSVNDLICVGAKPLLFLDYFATGKLSVNQAAQVIAGIHRGCEEADCLLLGGETAEMPGFYKPGEYDLAGFAVGELAPKALLPRSKVPPGSVLLGLRSSGFHSNGYSLIRKLLAQEGSKGRKAIVKDLLMPTRIYVKSVLEAIEVPGVLGMAHITGSGFLNVPRISEAVDYEILLPRLHERPRVYEWLERTGQVSFEESIQTFNQGIGMVIAVKPGSVEKVLQKLKKWGETVWVLGQTRKRSGKSPQVHVWDPRGNKARLTY